MFNNLILMTLLCEDGLSLWFLLLPLPLFLGSQTPPWPSGFAGIDLISHVDGSPRTTTYVDLSVRAIFFSFDSSIFLWNASISSFFFFDRLL